MRRNATFSGLALALALHLFVLGAPLAQAQSQHDEQNVRAAYIFLLTQYVTWPRANGEIVICYLGDKSMDQALLRSVDGKQVEGRKLHLLLRPSPAELKHCDILYVSNSAPKNTQTILAEIKNSPVLTVGDDDRFVREGGMIGLIRTGDQILLEANPGAASSAGLRISSHLLNIAFIAHTGKRG